MYKEMVSIQYNSNISTLNFNVLMWILFDAIKFQDIMGFSKPTTWEEFRIGIKVTEIRLVQLEKLKLLTNNGIY